MERDAAKQYGDGVKESFKLWNSYTPEQQAAIMEEGNAIYRDLVAHMESGPNSVEVQNILTRWHQHLRYFYEPTFEVLGGLGNLYHDSPDFNATFTALHPDLPGFLQQAIAYYVDILETEWLQRELGILEE
jgi:hypothetical protein